MEEKDAVAAICRFHGVNDIINVKPYKGARHGYTLAKSHTVTRTVTGHGPGEVKIFPIDQSQPVCVFAITVPRYKSTFSGRLAIKMNYYHESMSQAEGTRENDAFLNEVGYIGGAFMEVKPTNGEEVFCDATALRRLNFHYNHPEFIKCNALVTAQNIEVGIVPIDNGYVAIPGNHLLSWTLHGMDEKEYARRKLSVKQVRRKLPNEPFARILYFVVDGPTYTGILDAHTKMFLKKVDVRPLNSIGIEAVPMYNEKKGPQHAGDFDIRIRIGYIEFPQNLDLTSIAPVLSPKYPKCTDYR